MLSVLIPAYDEAESIAAVVARARETMEASGIPYELIVIDDGSSDGTGERAKADGVRVIRHPRNAGYGRALKTGIRESRYPWCAIVDADGSYPVEKLPELLAHVPVYDMVVGARTGSIYWGSFGRRLLRTALLRLVQFVAGTRHADARDLGAVGWRRGIDVQHGQGVVGRGVWIEERHVGQCFRRGLHGHRRRRVEGLVGKQCRHGLPSLRFRSARPETRIDRASASFGNAGVFLKLF